jgi:hypothetical protein
MKVLVTMKVSMKVSMKVKKKVKVRVRVKKKVKVRVKVSMKVKKRVRMRVSMKVKVRLRVKVRVRRVGEGSGEGQEKESMDKHQFFEAFLLEPACPVCSNLQRAVRWTSILPFSTSLFIQSYSELLLPFSAHSKIAPWNSNILFNSSQDIYLSFLMMILFVILIGKLIAKKYYSIVTT